MAQDQWGPPVLNETIVPRPLMSARRFFWANMSDCKVAPQVNFWNAETDWKILAPAFIDAV